MAKLHNDYYTYAYLREDKTPYYIGKGRGRRIYSKSKVIKPPDDKSRIIFLKKNLTEEEAFKHEIYMIAIFGRKDLGTGILRNLTNGGEGASGAVRSEEWKKARLKAMSGKFAGAKNPMFGMSGALCPTYGTTRTAAQKKAQSEKMTGKLLGALHSCSKAIYAIEPDGTKRHYGSGREAGRDLEIADGSLRYYLKIGQVLKCGKLKGWRFVFAATPSSTDN